MFFITFWYFNFIFFYVFPGKWKKYKRKKMLYDLLYMFVWECVSVYVQFFLPGNKNISTFLIIFSLHFPFCHFPACPFACQTSLYTLIYCCTEPFGYSFYFRWDCWMIYSFLYCVENCGKWINSKKYLMSTCNCS